MVTDGKETLGNIFVSLVAKEGIKRKNCFLLMHLRHVTQNSEGKRQKSIVKPLEIIFIILEG